MKNKLLIFMLLFYSVIMHGENKYGKIQNNSDRWNLSFNVGTSFSRADIREYNNFIDFNYLGFDGRIGIGYNHTPWLNSSLEVGFGSIKGVNTVRSLSFSGKTIGGATTLNINIHNLIGMERNRKFWVNIYGGLGFSVFNSKLYTYELSTPATIVNETLPGNREKMLTFPVGAEINYAATKDINFHIGYRHTFTNNDNLDLINEGVNDGFSSISFGVKIKNIFDKPKKSNKKIPKPNLRIWCDPQILVKDGDQVKYEINVDFPSNFIDKGEIACLQPILYYGNNKSLLLDPIKFGRENVVGVDRYIPQKGEQVKFSGSFNYNDEMKSAELHVISNSYQYKEIGILQNNENIENNFIKQSKNKIADGVRTTHEKFRLPNEFLSVALKNLDIEPFVLNFIRNTANINYNERYPDEESILLTISNRIKVCNRNPVKFIITSYASPEGEKQANMILSERRSAKALSLLAKTPGVQYKVQFITSREEIDLRSSLFQGISNVSSYKHNGLFKYTSGIFKTHSEAAKHCKLIRELGFSDAFVTVFKIDTYNEIVMRIENNDLTSENIERIINKGADWEGLDKKLDEEPNTYTKELKEKLKDKQYDERQIVLNRYYREKNHVFDKKILSDLRKTEIQFNCRLDNKSTENGPILLKDEYDRNPFALTENQLLHLVSKQINEDVKLEILSYLLNRFPNNEVALINMSSILANKGLFLEAQDLLNSIHHSKYGAYWYNKGLLELISRNYDKAAIHFKKAQDAGVNTTNAQRVIQIVNNTDLSQINFTDEDKYNYNSALLLLINNKLNKTDKFLETVKDSVGDVFYLKAVVAARLNDRAKVLSNLTKAINQNIALKAEAKKDVEFINYRKDAGFKKLLE